MEDKAKEEANLPLYEKKIEDQLDAYLHEFRTKIPQVPKWGIKKNSEGKNIFWFGYKGHLAVDMTSQYILPSFQRHSMAAGYDFEPIYKQIHLMGYQSNISYNKRTGVK